MKPVILKGARTPFGKFGGGLKDVTPVDMGIKVAKAAIADSGISKDEIDDVNFGLVIPCDSNSLYLARHIGLGIELPNSVPALTLNRLCGSGMESVIQASMKIMLGQSHLSLAGGVENMSRAPNIAQGARWGNRMGRAELDDILYSGLFDSYNGIGLGVTAENIAEKYQISREEQDEWACISQRRAEKAIQSGRFAKETIAMRVRTDKGRGTFEIDEFVRGEEGCLKISELPPIFKSGGTVSRKLFWN